MFRFGREEDKKIIREHKACVKTTVMLSVAFVESLINELFSDCADIPKSETLGQGLDIKVMGALWSANYLSKMSILDKYTLALKLNNKTPFDKGRSPWQGMSSLIDLRNELVHYKPETINYDGEDVHRVEKLLKGKFAENPHFGEGNPFYPDRIFGAGCARWSVETAVKFTDDFYARLGFEPRYQFIREEYGV